MKDKVFQGASVSISSSPNSLLIDILFHKVFQGYTALGKIFLIFYYFATQRNILHEIISLEYRLG